LPLAIVKDKVWDGLGYRPNRAQRRMHAARERMRVSAWGRRAGKSTSGGHELIPEVYRAYMNRAMLEDMGIRMEFWIVGPNYTDSEKEFRVFYNDCRRLKFPFDRPGTYNSPEGGNMHVSLWEGRFMVHAMSAAHPESLVGEGLHGAVMAEAAKMKQSVWTKYVRPTLADFKGWALFNSTPEGRNWFYELWQRGQDPHQLDWWSAKFPAWVNEHVYPQGASEKGIGMIRRAMEARLPITADLMERSGVDPEIISLMQDLTEEAFNQEIGADFNEFVGRVFKEFDEEYHVRDIEYNPDWPCYGAVDYGWTNPFVWLMIQEDEFGDLYIIDEYYETQRDINDVALDLIDHRTMGPLFRNRKVKMFYPDPAEPGDTEVLRKHLRINAGAQTGGELKHRIEAIRRFLKDRNEHLPAEHVDRKPRLIVDRRCVNTIREFNAYRYPEKRSERDKEKNAPENPMKKDDHTPEALGRFMAGRGHVRKVVGTGAGAPRVSKATVDA
jgi:hypothetical protein